MGIAKVIFNGNTLMDVTQKTVTSGSMLNGTTALKNDGTNITGNIASKTSSDMTVSDDTVTAPAGYYASSQSKSVASGTAGTPSATKGTVSNHSVSVTPSVTNTTGYITGGTKTGTAVTVSASELVSGSETKTANGTYDVTNLASVVVNVSGGGSGGVDIPVFSLTYDENYDVDTFTCNKTYAECLSSIQNDNISAVIEFEDSDGYQWANPVTFDLDDWESIDPNLICRYGNTSGFPEGEFIYQPDGTLTDPYEADLYEFPTITTNGQHFPSDGKYFFTGVDVQVPTGGGGGGSYPWYGANTVLDYTKTITINLKDDTSWDSWTASTTATSILAAPSTADFSYTFDFTQYVATVVTRCVTNYVYIPTATKTYIPISNGKFDHFYLYGRPSSYSEFANGIISTLTNVSFSSQNIYYYYNNASNKACVTTQTGAYVQTTPTITGSVSGNNYTLSYKRSAIYAKCANSYFDIGRKNDIDSENTNIVITVEVYKTPIANQFMHVEFDKMRLAMNAAPENQ